MADNVSGIGRGVTFGNGQQVFCAGDDVAPCEQQGQEYISSYKAQTIPCGAPVEIDLSLLQWVLGYFIVKWAVKAGVTAAIEKSSYDIARVVRDGAAAAITESRGVITRSVEEAVNRDSIAQSLARYYPTVAGDSNSIALPSHAIAQAIASLPIEIRNTIEYEDVVNRTGALLYRLSEEGYHLRDGKFVFDAKAARK